MENSHIAWTTHTFNTHVGCQQVSAGCALCYAEAQQDHRYGRVQWGPHGERLRTSAAEWKKPIKWAREARATGMRPRVFCASLADVFDNKAADEIRYDLYDIIDATPELDWLLLTKRPENISNMLTRDLPSHVWLGTSCEDQENLDRRWPILSSIPARIHFISYEPALGPIRLPETGKLPDWIICGGESDQGGAKARPMLPEWARDMRDQCRELGVAFFMKQMARGARIPADLLVREFPI